MKKIILVGPSASGKDYLLRYLRDKGLKYSPKYTTRPKRVNEQEGVEYFFIDNNKFYELNSEDFFITHQSFNIKGETWVYAISRENFNSNQLFIMTPYELSTLSDEYRDNSVIVYLDIDVETRRRRISNREDRNDEIQRRIDADEVDFKDFCKYDVHITNPLFDFESIYESLLFEVE